MPKVVATRVRRGDRIRTGGGEVIKVLCSVPEAQSSASGSVTVWHIEGYAPGLPTRRLFCRPDSVVDLVEDCRGSCA